MTKRRSWCLAAGIVLAGVVAFVFAAGSYYYKYIIPRMVDEKLVQEGPPQMLVYSPEAGDTFPAGTTMMAEAVVTATRPIERVEIWLDGALADMQRPDAPDKTRFHAYFQVEIGAGTHIVSWRAVDSRGLVGQSAAIPIAGEAMVAEIGQGSGDDEQIPPAGVGGQQPQPGSPPNAGEPPAGNAPNAGGAPGGGAGGQQPQGGGAWGQELPEPGAGAYKAFLVASPLIDFGRLIPRLLSSLPAAPSHLEAGFEPCTVRLVWNDNADNEDRFEVWMQKLGGAPIRIKTTTPNPGTGSTWFEFDSPSFGIYSFWVAAANALGSQPSEIASVAVNDASCGEGVASQLEIEVLGMRVAGDFGNQMYCYLSVEGFPERRIPEDENEFLHKDASGAVNIYEWLGSKRRILANMPADDEVTLEGDCWALLGTDNPQSMGPDAFGVGVPKEHWDNRTLQIRTTNYVIDFRIHPFGSTDAEGTFGYLDYGIPAPQITSVVVEHSNDPLMAAEYARTPSLEWRWAPDDHEINAFVIHANGSVIDWVPDPPARRERLILPSACGATYELQIAAQADQARSPFSAPVTYTQIPCPAYADVAIKSFQLTWVHSMSTQCDPAFMLMDVVVNDLWREYVTPQVACGNEYPASDLSLFKHRGPLTDALVFRVPLDAANPYIQMRVSWWRENNEFVDWYEKTISIPPEQWDTYRQDVSESRPSGLWVPPILNYSVEVVRGP